MNSNKSNTSSEQLEFDFDFDDLDDDIDDDGVHEDVARPYQWDTNIQFVNIDVDRLSFSKRSSNSFDTDFDDEKEELEEEIAESIPSRQISSFSPPLYDICSVICAPLSIADTDDKIPLISLEYIRSHLPDLSEFNEYLYDILYESRCELRIANSIGTVDNISQMLWSNGGSKIIHFIAYICNPFDCSADDPLRYTFPNESYYKCNTQYILIENSSFMNGRNGSWIKVRDLKRMIKFDCDLNDIMITISPQSVELCNILRNIFGYKYVIGVKCTSNNYNSFSSSETAIFLKYFYSSILHQECLDRAFELAKTAAILQRTRAINGTNDKYILLTLHDNNSARYVVFPHLIEGRQITNHHLIKSNLRRHIIRPFIGRAQDVIHLIHNIMHHKASLVIGDENNGRKALIQTTVRYLLQHLYFGAAFIIDLSDKGSKDSLIERIYNVLCDEIEEEEDLFINMNNLFRKLNDDTLFDSICFVILNINKWDNNDEIVEFIDIFNRETNDKCRVILSTDTNIDINIASLHISALNREYISQIFISLTLKYNISDIINDDKLHKIFGGSPRITKRVAEFVNSESHSLLTLDEIAQKYQQSAFAKTIQSTKELLTVSIPQNVINTNDCQWNTSFEHREGDTYRSFSLNLVPNNTEFPFSFSSHQRSRNNSVDTYSTTDYDTYCSQSGSGSQNTTDYDDDDDEDIEEIEEEMERKEGIIYRNDEFLSVKSISNDYRLTCDGLRKHLSPRAHRRHNTYSIPDFCSDDHITHIFTSIPEVDEETEEEEEEELLKSVDFDILYHDFDSNYQISHSNTSQNKVLYHLLSNNNNESFPDISALKNDGRFEIIISQLPLTPLTPTKRLKKESIALFDNESVDFDGLSTYTTFNQSMESLSLSPKDSDEPVIECNLAKIGDNRSITMSGYNSGSTSDTPSPSINNICEKKGSIAVFCCGHHTQNMSLSNHELHDVTDSLSLKLMNDCAPLPLPLPFGSDVHLNIIAHLSRCKDGDARAIWMQSAKGLRYNQYAYLYKLYPFLIKKFQVTTRTKNRYPEIHSLEHYFLQNGGKYLRNTNFSVIHITKYNKFYCWFIFMCHVVNDLREIYDDYNLDSLFYAKPTSSEILKMRPKGTFILSLTNKINYLSIKYKKTTKSQDISSILLIRHSKDLYSINKCKKKASLYQIIRPRTYLKYLYTPQMLIHKKALF